MSEKIEPALTPEEWTAYLPVRIGSVSELGDHAALYPDSLPALIAIANAALPDTDPRKITREHIRACRRELNDWVEDRDEILRRLAAALESYLPPEPT